MPLQTPNRPATSHRTRVSSHASHAHALAQPPTALQPRLRRQQQRQHGAAHAPHR